MLKIMEQYSSDKNLFVEELIKEIPHEVSSRLSIFGFHD
jgi:predicted Zn-dependent protease